MRRIIDPNRWILFSLALLTVTSAVQADVPDWVPAMRRVRAMQLGEPGVVMNIGDSITYSMAYFAPLQHVNHSDAPPAVQKAIRTLDDFIQPDCYRWKGPNKGNASGRTARWALGSVDDWIDQLHPQIAIVMFGTNDIRQGSVADYEKNLRQLVERCSTRGVVVILTTIPPMHGFDEKVALAVSAQRRIARECSVPLIDLHAQILNRRPHDWDGSLPAFDQYAPWQAPTLVSHDGVHLSNPDVWRQAFTPEGLARNGNTLRNYLTLRACAEVIDVVFQEKVPGATTELILGPNPPAPETAETDPASGKNFVSNGSRSDLPDFSWLPEAPPLPEPTGPVIRADTVAGIDAAAESIPRGGTILLDDGHYAMKNSLHLRTADVTLRSASGNRDAVVLDFSKSRHHEGIVISECSGVTVANLTVANVRQNGIKINSNLGVDHVTLYNLVSHNVWQRHVKGPKVPDQQGRAAFVEGCRIEHCLFYNDRPKQRGDEPWEDENPQMAFNYIGGIDVMSAKQWVIRDNVFWGIHGASGEARGAVFLWHNSTDCIVDRNVIVDCDSGICLGNSSARGERRHAVRCLVRNNFVVSCPENNLLADHTRDCRIEHNTVHDPDGPFGRLLRVVHANDGLVVRNNLFSGPRIVVETDREGLDIRNNLIRPLTDYFVDPTVGDLHLTTEATDAFDHGIDSPDVVSDIDSQPRSVNPDLGADERP